MPYYWLTCCGARSYQLAVSPLRGAAAVLTTAVEPVAGALDAVKLLLQVSRRRLTLHIKHSPHLDILLLDYINLSHQIRCKNTDNMQHNQ